MTNPARKMSRAEKQRAQKQAKIDRKFMRHRKANLAALPHVIREWARELGESFKDKGLVAGAVMPKPPTKGNDLWRVVFVLPTGIQCAECGETSADGEARYTIFQVDGDKWMSASCFACHKSREPGNAAPPQKGDA